MNQSIPGGLAAAALLALLSPLAAQSPALQSEIDFVRGLVAEFRFVDYAKEEIQRLKKSYKDSADFKAVAQLDIEVSLEGAKLHKERSERRGLYKRALEESAAFIERYSGEPVALDAMVTLTLACLEFGEFLNQEIEIAREEDPDKVPDLETEAASVFRQGTEAAENTKTAFANSGRQLDSYVARMRKGILMREHGRAVAKDREIICVEADIIFEELIFEVGEETMLGQKALFEKSKIHEVLGNLDAATSSYSDAIASIWISLTDSSLDLPLSLKRAMFNMMQEVYDALATAYYKQGRSAEILELVQQFEDRVKEFQTEPHPAYGDSLLLTRASVQSISGKQAEVSQALKTAQEINDRHPADYVGLKAKKLIGDILRRSAGLVTGDLLFEVAKGEYQNKEYEASISGFKRALNSMDAAARERLGFESWLYLGRANYTMQRYLESALAYSRALEDFGSAMQAKGDKDAEDQLKQTATRAASALARVENASNKHPVFAALRSKIDSQLEDYNKDIAQANDYGRGLQAKRSGKYDEAASSFFSVQKSYARYELAIGFGIESLYRAGKFEEARAKIAEYRKFVEGSELAADDREKRAYRPQAMAWAHYWEGRMLYEEAEGRGKDAKPDLTKFKAVIQHFQEFESVHADHAAAQMVTVHGILGRAFLETGEDVKARERYARLKELGKSYPDAHRALGLAIYKTFTDDVDAREIEVNKLIKESKPVEAAEARLESARRKALELGIDYAKTIGQPSYALLYNNVRLAEDLEDWPACEWNVEHALKLYTGKEESKARSFLQLKPILGYALLQQQGRLQEAYDVLTAAEKELAGDKKSSTYYEVLRYQALALGGWPAMDKTGINYEPIPGMGKPGEAWDIYWNGEYRQGYGLNPTRAPRFSFEWYQYHLEALFFAHQARRLGGEFETRAQTLFNMAQSFDDFATLEKFGRKGVRLKTLFQYLRS